MSNNQNTSIFNRHFRLLLILIVFAIFLVSLGITIGLVNVSLMEQQKITETLSILSCNELIDIPQKYDYWMNDSDCLGSHPSKLFLTWKEEMKRCNQNEFDR